MQGGFGVQKVPVCKKVHSLSSQALALDEDKLKPRNGTLAGISAIPTKFPTIVIGPIEQLLSQVSFHRFVAVSDRSKRVKTM